MSSIDMFNFNNFTNPLQKIRHGEISCRFGAKCHNTRCWFNHGRQFCHLELSDVLRCTNPGCSYDHFEGHIMACQQFRGFALPREPEGNNEQFVTEIFCMRGADGAKCPGADHCWFNHDNVAYCPYEIVGARRCQNLFCGYNHFVNHITIAKQYRQKKVPLIPEPADEQSLTEQLEEEVRVLEELQAQVMKALDKA